MPPSRRRHFAQFQPTAQDFASYLGALEFADAGDIRLGAKADLVFLDLRAIN